jgi:hypothetical protein
MGANGESSDVDRNKKLMNELEADAVGSMMWMG